MAGGEAVGAELAGEAQEVGKLHPLVAGDAGDRRAPARIFVGEALDHALPEAALIVEDMMSDAQPRRHRLRVENVLAGATSARARAGDSAMVVELQRHPDRLRAAARGEGGHDRAVDAARHGDDDPGALQGPGELEIRVHRRAR